MKDENNKKKAENLFIEGLNKLKNKDFLNAKTLFFSASQLLPERTSILYNLALSHYYLEEKIDSINILKKIILADSKDFDSIKLLLIILLDQNRFNEILEITYNLDTKTEEKYKNDILDLFYEITSKLLVVGDLDINQKFYKKYLSLDQKNLETYLESLFIVSSIYIDNAKFNSSRSKFQENLENIKDLEINNYKKKDRFPRIMTFYLSYNNENNLPILKKFTQNISKLYPVLNMQLNLKYSSLMSKIRIGFVSEFLTDHTIGKLFSSLILELDANKFDVTVFHSSKTKNGYIKKLIDLKVRTVNLPSLLKDKIKVLENAKLDIVFYTDIGMSGDLYYLTFYRFAKFQINTWGHPETSGNNNIDYFLSNEMSESYDSSKYYSEKLIKFKNFNIYCDAPRFNNKEFKYNFPQNKNIYFCPQTIFKLVPDFDEVLKGIIDLDQKALIFFIKDSYHHQYKTFLQRLKNKKIDLDKIIFLDRLSQSEFIYLCGKSDVLLDPLYFGAGNSFIETFLYPVPLVTCPGTFLRSRLALGLYKQLNVQDAPICKSTNDYVFKAAELANNKKNNILIREQISEKGKFFFKNKNVLTEYENFFLNLMNGRRDL
jgi:predicted O-linked N-acetylglucosamine transferase (SPINDLY family)